MALRRLGVGIKDLMMSSSSRTFCSSKGVQPLTAEVVLSTDNRTLVCYHPTPDFPYEYSRPLPDITTDPLDSEDRFLKMRFDSDWKRRGRGGPDERELAAMFYEHHTVFYPNAMRDRRLTVRPRQGKYPHPSNREYTDTPPTQIIHPSSLKRRPIQIKVRRPNPRQKYHTDYYIRNTKRFTYDKETWRDEEPPNPQQGDSTGVQ